MPITVNTFDYEFSHGRSPRGRGHWAFFFDRRARIEDAYWVEGYYTEAKRLARLEAQRRGVCEVFVGS